MQRDYFNGLKSELERRKAQGEDDLIIKYKNDVPFITKRNYTTKPDSISGPKNY